MFDLRSGPWETALADVKRVDALIVDPPYSARTHGKQKAGRRLKEQATAAGNYVSSRGLPYGAWGKADVAAFVRHWSPITNGWFCAFTDSELYPEWRDALQAAGRTVFAPIPCIQIGMAVRLAGDGPSSWTTWLVVARPSALSRWGTLQGAYIGNPFDAGQNSSRRRGRVVGSKPLWLMRAIVSDYTLPGDLICDPCAGGGTTLLAAVGLKRRAIGAERNPHAYDYAAERLREATVPLPLERLAALPANDNSKGDPHGAA